MANAAVHDHEHDVLQSWQAAIGLLTAVIGLLYVTRKKPAGSEAEQQLATPVGPGGLGEVGGGGGGASGSVSPVSGAPSSPALTGEQSSPTSTARRGGGGGGGHLVGENLPKGSAAPGEGQAEFERHRIESFPISPGTAARRVGGGGGGSVAF